jgi:two-component system sensor histidine kinase SaeS
MRIVRREAESGRHVEVPDEHCPHFDHAYPTFDEHGSLKEAMFILKAGSGEEQSQEIAPGNKKEEDTKALLATIYHDLASPLQVIRACSDLISMELEENDDDSRAVMRDMLEASKRNERRLYEMVRTIRLIPSLEEDRMHTLEPVALRDALRDICSDYRLLLPPDVSLELDVPPSIPDVLAVPDLLDRVFFNLLDNAARYTHSGGHIRISVECDDTAEELTIKVFDDGDAIPEKLQSRIFEKNMVVDVAGQPIRSRRDHGWGLYFCKLVIERFGGTIGVESRKGWGTEFSLTLPFASSLAQPASRRAQRQA